MAVLQAFQLYRSSCSSLRDQGICESQIRFRACHTAWPLDRRQDQLQRLAEGSLEAFARFERSSYERIHEAVPLAVEGRGDSTLAGTQQLLGLAKGKTSVQYEAYDCA